MLTAQSGGKCQKTILLKSCTTSQRAPDPNDCFLGHPVMPHCTKMLKFKKYNSTFVSRNQIMHV